MARIAASDGVGLHAEVHGDGPTVLLSCALNTTCENWRPQVAPLVAAGFRVALWDYRGHGRSDAPDDPARYSMEQVVDDLGRVLDWAAPGRRAVVGGLSFGGLASLHFALRAPQRVAALLLVDSGPGFKKPEAQAAWQASVERTASFIEAQGLEAFAARATELTVGAHPESPAARAALRAIAAQRPHGLAHFGRRIAALAPPVIDELPRIEAPALVVVGELDAAYQRAAEVMAARLPHARTARIPRAGHMVNLDEPAAFEAAVIAFLSEVRAAAA